MKTISSMLSVAMLLGGLTSMVKASSDHADLESLQQSILALQKRVETLEAIKPTFTSFMPDFSERFHVLHRAGEAGDWAVAGHEFEEMKRMMALSKYIDAENSISALIKNLV
jgi:hypothetical protein